MRFLLGSDLVREVADLLLLDALESHSIVTRLLDLPHKLFLLFCQVAHTGLHLRLVLFGLLVLLSGDPVRTVQTLALLLELLFLQA